ncbi:MAG: hypothetical protein J3Q66DRAFT_426406, partial [Benniella sp.]
PSLPPYHSLLPSPITFGPEDSLASPLNTPQERPRTPSHNCKYHHTRMAAAGIYVGIVLGALVLFSVCVGILYHQHRKEVNEIQALEQAHAQVLQERMQHVLDQNLPPFYVDHERDPVCVYEHELHPDVVPPEQPIVVHSATDETHIILPEDDPLVASPSSLASSDRSVSSFPFPTMSRGTSADVEGIVHSGPSIDSDMVQDLQQQAELRALTPPVRGISRSTSPSSIGSSRVIDRTMLNQARLPAPPSYDISNSAMARSSHLDPHRHPRHSHSYSASDIRQFMTPPPAADYFGQVRARSHTISHSQEQGGESLPVTPRYSLEFPSHIPHHHHLAEYQRLKALYDTFGDLNPQYPSSSSSFVPVSHCDGSAVGPHMLTIQDRSHSQPNYHLPSLGTPSFSSPTTTLGQQRQRHEPRLGSSRARASTIGESSKLLVQRMQLLWKRTASTTLSSPLSSRQDSLNMNSAAQSDQEQHQGQPGAYPDVHEAVPATVEYSNDETRDLSQPSFASNAGPPAFLEVSVPSAEHEHEHEQEQEQDTSSPWDHMSVVASAQFSSISPSDIMPSISLQNSASVLVAVS